MNCSTTISPGIKNLPGEEEYPDAALNQGSPVYLTSIFKLSWTPARTIRRRELQHLALRISFRSFESFMGVQKKEKTRFQKGINNKSSMHLSRAAGETQFNPSIMFRPLFCSNLWGNTEGRNQWMIYKDIFLMNCSKGSCMRFHLCQTCVSIE